MVSKPILISPCHGGHEDNGQIPCHFASEALWCLKVEDGWFVPGVHQSNTHAWAHMYPSLLKPYLFLVCYFPSHAEKQTRSSQRENLYFFIFMQRKSEICCCASLRGFFSELRVWRDVEINDLLAGRGVFKLLQSVCLGWRRSWRKKQHWFKGSKL